MRIEEMPERVRYKVLTLGRESTGLLHSRVMRYRLKRWNFPHDPPRPGKEGPGGLWASRNKAQARSLQRYLAERHGMETRIHLCLIGRVLFESSYRTKTDRLFLMDPIA